MSLFSQWISKHKDLLVLFAVEVFLLSVFPPSLLLSSTHIAGGDTASHFPSAVEMRRMILAGEFPFTWSYGNYAGFPLFLNYFPLSFLLIALLSFVIPIQIAFKLVTLLAVLPLPVAAYDCLRRLKYPPPVPLFGGVSVLLFLFVREQCMWGGNFGSMLAGEFSCGIAFSLALWLTGRLYSDVPQGRGLVKNAVIEAATALCSGYPLLHAGFGSSWFVFRRGGFRYLTGLHVLAFCFIGFWILPLIARLSWGSPYSHTWIFADWKEVLPPVLIPVWTGIPVGLFASFSSWRKDEGAFSSADSYLWWQVLVALVCFGSAPVTGLVDIRFLPFAQLYLLLLGAVGWGRAAMRMGEIRNVAWSALFLCVPTILAVYGITPAPSWILWNYSGMESKPLWPAYREVNSYLAGDAGDPRVVYEHSEKNSEAGTLRAFEMLPYFSGRSTLEGLYMQSGLNAPFVFYIQSELSRNPSCPYPLYSCAGVNPGRAAAHLRLFNANRVVVSTEDMVRELGMSPEYRLLRVCDPFRVYELDNFTPSYIVPLHFLPYKIPFEGWKQRQFQ